MNTIKEQIDKYMTEIVAEIIEAEASAQPDELGMDVVSRAAAVKIVQKLHDLYIL